MMEAHGMTDGAGEVGKDGSELMAHDSATDTGGTENQIDTSTGQQDDQAAAEDTSWFDAQKFPIKYRGATHYPRDLEHTQNLLRMGWENDRRMGQFKEREDELTASEKEVAEYKKVQAVYDQNPKFAAEMRKLVLAYQDGNPAAAASDTAAAEGDLSPREQQMMEKIAGLEQKFGTVESRFEDYDATNADESVKKEIKELRDAYPDEDWDTPDEQSGKTLEQELLHYAHENDFGSLRAAYRDKHFDSIIEKEKAKALKDADESKQKNKKAGTISDGGGAHGDPNVTTIDPRKATYDQLTEMAVKEMT